MLDEQVHMLVETLEGPPDRLAALQFYQDDLSDAFVQHFDSHILRQGEKIELSIHRDRKRIPSLILLEEGLAREVL